MSKSKKIKNRSISVLSRQGIMALCLVFVMAFSVAGFSVAQADQFDTRIKELEKQNNKKEAAAAQLGSEAKSLKDLVNKLQVEINAKAGAIRAHQKEITKLKQEIKKAEIELERQKGLLRDIIRAIYVEGDISTVEMLASSDDLADFFDQQQYRESVSSQVKTTLDKVNQLKLDLSTKKDKAEKLLKEQTRLKNQLLSQRSEKNRLLSLNKSEQNKVEAQIRANQRRIASIRAEQLAANKRAISSGGVSIVARGNCGGGYPRDAVNNFGARWGCNYPLDNTIDNWGMYNRECVSYTAYRVAASGRDMPYWGGRGNAHLWDDNARSAGIKVDSNPRVGDVAVAEAGGYYGPVGHVMYVEAVLGGGWIRVSQFNFGAPGQYSEMNVRASGLEFIHF
ncbi:CHAP domain-containing protein [Candidatus Parcubacteria bacterium]|nr:CHAP domain-containing protein [Candidatus Parcubacteria bacterium]